MKLFHTSNLKYKVTKYFKKIEKSMGGGGVMFSLRGHTFMTSTKYYEFCDPPAPSSAKMNNRSFV